MQLTSQSPRRGVLLLAQLLALASCWSAAEPGSLLLRRRLQADEAAAAGCAAPAQLPECMLGCVPPAAAGNATARPSRRAGCSCGLGFVGRRCTWKETPSKVGVGGAMVVFMWCGYELWKWFHLWHVHDADSWQHEAYEVVLIPGLLASPDLILLVLQYLQMSSAAFETSVPWPRDSAVPWLLTLPALDISFRELGFMQQFFGILGVLVLTLLVARAAHEHRQLESTGGCSWARRCSRRSSASLSATCTRRSAAPSRC